MASAKQGLTFNGKDIIQIDTTFRLFRIRISYLCNNVITSHKATLLHLLVILVLASKGKFCEADDTGVIEGKRFGNLRYPEKVYEFNWIQRCQVSIRPMPDHYQNVTQ